MKEEFKYLYSFKYKNKDYIYLYNENYPMYIMEYQNNTLIPVDLNTYIELYEKFNSNFLFTIKDKLIEIKNVLSNISFLEEPVVRTTSGILSLALVLSLCGCKQVELPEKTPSSVIEQTTESTQEPTVEEYFKKYNIDVDTVDYNGNVYYFVKSCIDSNGITEITLKDINEFKAFKGITKDITYDDVENAFKNNPNITDEYKEIILKGLNNLKTSEDFKSLDLTVLYENAKRMEIISVPHSALVEKVNNESVYAFFETKTGKVYVPNDEPIKEFEFIHEVLGHGSLAYRESIEDKSYYYDGTVQLMLKTDNRYTGYAIGTTYSEGGANLIARASVPGENPHSFYNLFEEELRLIAGYCNMSIGELLNYKGKYLYDLMYHNAINDPVSYIIQTDAITNGIIYTEFSTLMENLAIDATYEKIYYGDETTQEEVIQSTIDLINDSTFKEGLGFNYDGGTIEYIPSDVADSYEEQIRGRQ